MRYLRLTENDLIHKEEIKNGFIELYDNYIWFKTSDIDDGKYHKSVIGYEVVCNNQLVFKSENYSECKKEFDRHVMSEYRRRVKKEAYTILLVFILVITFLYILFTQPY